ncbi:hypothetical protein HDV01_007883 [Terramyces sp. JEL0728]|nr:hypothetical protein HDV01_007883 [Terramyces sp. JEL0728]
MTIVADLFATTSRLSTANKILATVGVIVAGTILSAIWSVQRNVAKLKRLNPNITSPQFSERNNVLVHKESIQVVSQMMEYWESSGEVKDRVDITKNMFNVALHIISSAAFGKQLDWVEDPTKIQAGHKRTFKQNLQFVVHKLTTYLATPKFMFKLPIQKLKDIKSNFDEFHQYMTELYLEAKKPENLNKSNLMSALVKASMNESEYSSLADDEHETTAGTLNYAFTLLASNPRIQERLHQEIVSVCGNEIPDYKHLNEIPYTFAVMNETLRLYPPVIAIPKVAVGEQTLGRYVIPDGSHVGIHAHGLHYNSKYWGPDPEKFRPERWFSDQECASSASKVRERISESTAIRSFFKFDRWAFVPFSEGVRSCLGRRFAEVEMLVVLIMVCQKYEFSVPNGDAALKSSNFITLKTTDHVTLRMNKRK